MSSYLTSQTICSSLSVNLMYGEGQDDIIVVDAQTEIKFKYRMITA